MAWVISAWCPCAKVLRRWQNTALARITRRSRNRASWGQTHEPGVAQPAPCAFVAGRAGFAMDRAVWADRLLPKPRTRGAGLAARWRLRRKPVARFAPRAACFPRRGAVDCPAILGRR